MSARTWILLAVFFVAAIFAYDFLTKQPKKAARWDEASLIKEYAGWKEFQATNGAFQVRFPTAPQHTSAAEAAKAGGSGDVRYDVYLSQGPEKTTFLISSLEYPAPISIAKEETIFDAVLNDMLSSSSNSTLLRSQKGTFLQLPSFDFTVKTADFTTKSRTFLNGRFLYVLTVMSKSPEKIDRDFEMFVSSFTLVPDDKRTEEMRPAEK